MLSLEEKFENLKEWIWVHTANEREYARALRTCDFTKEEVREELNSSVCLDTDEIDEIMLELF